MNITPGNVLVTFQSVFKITRPYIHKHFPTMYGNPRQVLRDIDGHLPELDSGDISGLVGNDSRSLC
jgi:hypothetical protein